MIDTVRAASLRSLSYKPNIVLINAGTNDARLGEDIFNAGNRMRILISTLINSEDMQDAVIILSTLIPSNSSAIKTWRDEINAQYRDLVPKMRSEGVSIVLANIDPELEVPGEIGRWMIYPDDYTANGQQDDTHPGDKGYRKMAYVWAKAIEGATAEGLIRQPVRSNSPGQVCEKDYGDGLYASGLTQRGSGVDDGIYYHDSEAQGILFSIRAGAGVEIDNKDM
jgi:hypothetical protein